MFAATAEAAAGSSSAASRPAPRSAANGNGYGGFLRSAALLAKGHTAPGTHDMQIEAEADPVLRGNARGVAGVPGSRSRSRGGDSDVAYAPLSEVDDQVANERSRSFGEDSDESSPGPVSCGEVCSREGPHALLNVESEGFNLIVGTVIILNAILIGFETDMGAEHFVAFDHFFVIFFLAEMILRHRQLGVCGYWSRPANCFDGFLVITSLADLYLLPLIRGPRKHGGASLMKLLRMFRIVRIIRIFRMFRALGIIMQAFIKALNSVLWVVLLTIILMYILAVFLTETIGHMASEFEDDQEFVELWFGNIGCSIRTLCIIMTLAEWDDIAMTLSDHINPIVVFVVAMAYITLTAFTMVSLITGTMTECLITAQKEDEISRMREIEEQRREISFRIRDMLRSADADDSGTLSKAEVKSVLHDPENKLLLKLETLDIDMSAEEFMAFVDKLPATKDGEVKIEDIAEAMEHMQGSAKASSVWDLRQNLNQVRIHMESRLDRVESKLDRICKHLGG